MASGNAAERSESTGTQTVSRVVAILRAVAGGGAEGRRLSEIAAEIGLHVATTHRIISALVREGLLERMTRSKSYRIGREIALLGASFQHRTSVQDYFEAAMNRLAERTADTVFLSVRSGSDAICVARREGTFPIRTLTLNVGDRRPLGVGAGSLALLAFAEETERPALIRLNADRYARFGQTAETVSQMVSTSLNLGYALNDGRILADMTAVAIPVHSSDGRIVAAVSVAAINARMTGGRPSEIVTMMREEVARIGPIPDHV